MTQITVLLEIFSDKAYESSGVMYSTFYRQTENKGSLFTVYFSKHYLLLMKEHNSWLYFCVLKRDRPDHVSSVVQSWVEMQ